MKSAANSQNLSVSTACNGIGLSDGSQATNQLTCAWATVANGIAPSGRHAKAATAFAALNRARVTPLRLIAPLCRRIIKRIDTKCIDTKCIDQIIARDSGARFPRQKSIRPQARSSAPTRTPDSDSNESQPRTRRALATKNVQSHDRPWAAV